MADIEHIQYLNAPASVVYEALTTHKGLSAVWTTELAVEAKVGAVNEFRFGPDDTTRMKVLELVPNRRVLWECVDSDPEWVGTKVGFELEERDGKVALTLRHMDWREVTEFYRWCNYNWAMFLYSLKQYCEEGGGTPYQRRGRRDIGK